MGRSVGAQLVCLPRDIRRGQHRHSNVTGLQKGGSQRTVDFIHTGPGRCPDQRGPGQRKPSLTHIFAVLPHRFLHHF